MDASGGDEAHVPGLYGHPAQKRLHRRPRQARAPQPLQLRPGNDAVYQFAPRFRPEDQPRLGLAQLAVLMLVGIGVPGMHLHAQGFPGVQELEQQGEGLPGVGAHQLFPIAGDKLRELYPHGVGALQAGNAADLQALPGGIVGDLLAVDLPQLFAAPGGQAAAAEGGGHGNGQQRAVRREGHLQAGIVLAQVRGIVHGAGPAHALALIQVQGGGVLRGGIAAQAVAAHALENLDDLPQHLAAQALPPQLPGHGKAMEAARPCAEEPVHPGVLLLLLLVDGHGADGRAPLPGHVKAPGFQILPDDVPGGVFSPAPLVQPLHLRAGAFVQGADGLQVLHTGNFQHHAVSSPFSVYISYR